VAAAAVAVGAGEPGQQPTNSGPTASSITAIGLTSFLMLMVFLLFDDDLDLERT
jgi:hypothetical protein